MFDFRLVCAADISGAICLTRIGPSTGPNQRYCREPQLWQSTFAIRGRLSPRICTERSCCLGLWEDLSGWVDLVGKHPSPQIFTCWCFDTWVVWSFVHFVSWLVMGFMIFSWSAWWTYPESLLFNVIFLRIDTSVGLVPLVRISNTWKCWW
jgi:hypothetical protein